MATRPGLRHDASTRTSPEARDSRVASEISDYFFCGKGCKLEFDDDPERYLDPSYVPSM